MNSMRQIFLTIAVISILSASPALAQTYNSGSTGADGAFTATCSPTPCTQTVALPVSGVFNFTTITVPLNVTVKFVRNNANTPVIMLAQGDVTIGGTIDVSGGLATGGGVGTLLASTAGVGGPGGGDGGTASNGIVSNTAGSGRGPGGGTGGPVPPMSAGWGGGGGGFAFPGGPAVAGTPGGLAYGTATLLPIIGGSGGGGGGTVLGFTAGGGGGGGGGLLIASSGTITLTGNLLATGGSGASCFGGGCGGGGGGSGGAIRLAATTITGTGSLNVIGGAFGRFQNQAGPGSIGRIRVEAYSFAGANFNVNGAQASTSFLPNPARLSPDPTLQITTIAGASVPANPAGSFVSPDLILPSSTGDMVTVVLQGMNFPSGTTAAVTVTRYVGGTPDAPVIITLTGSPLQGSGTIHIPLDQPAIISASLTFTVIASAGSGPVFVEGEPIERVRLTATAGGPTLVTYLAKSGREIPATAVP